MLGWKWIEPMLPVFISYRRPDSQNATGRIHDRLDMYFGEKIVFRDIDDLPGGVDFPAELEKALVDCKALIAVIGQNWLDAKNDSGERRLDDPADYVRQEIAAGLNRNIHIFPVLVSNASMPKREQLPVELKKLASKNAIHAPPDHNFHQGVATLAKRISIVTGIPYEDYPSAIRQCQEIGLVLIKGDFREDSSVLAEIENSRELIVVQNDGRSWIDSNRERLLARLSDRTKTTRIVLYHPRSSFLHTLIQKNGKRFQDQIGEIKRSYEIVKNAKADVKALDIRGHFGFNPYSLLVSDRYAFLSPYHYHEVGKLPVFKFSAHAPSPLYMTLRTDAEHLYENAEVINPQDFELALRKERRTIRKAPRAAH
jgi:hypothetical protein